jgi:DNA-binding response OmpR family regulator
MTRKNKTHTVLIIEDDLDIQNFISRVLELEGYRVIRANDGQTGMELIRANSVSLVLLDLRLPGPDGWSILQEIKGNPAHSKVPVVVLTAIAESVQQRRTLSMGASKYLIKPLSAHKLSKTVAGILHQEGKSGASKSKAAVKNQDNLVLPKPSRIRGSN